MRAESHLTSIIREGWLYKIPRSKAHEDLGGLPERRWKARFIQLTACAVEWFLPRAGSMLFQGIEQLNAHRPRTKGLAFLSMDKRGVCCDHKRFQSPLSELLPLCLFMSALLLPLPLQASWTWARTFE